MRIFSSLGGLLLFFTAISGFHAQAIAQPNKPIEPRANETIAEAFNRAYFQESPDFYRNRSFKRQLDWMFGSNGFVDNEIIRDAEHVNNLYEAVLEQQVSSDPPIRTRDLRNPYETSILSSPATDVNPGVKKDEVIFERR